MLVGIASERSRCPYFHDSPTGVLSKKQKRKAVWKKSILGTMEKGIMRRSSIKRKGKVGIALRCVAVQNTWTKEKAYLPINNYVIVIVKIALSLLPIWLAKKSTSCFVNNGCTIIQSCADHSYHSNNHQRKKQASVKSQWFELNLPIWLPIDFISERQMPDPVFILRSVHLTTHHFEAKVV